MMQSMPLQGQENVFLGNGQGLSINSIGSASFTSPTFPSITLHLKNMLLVPSITKSLISVSQFIKDNNVYFELNSTTCLVKSQADHKVLLQGTLGSDGLYQLPVLHLLQKTSAPSPVTLSCIL